MRKSLRVADNVAIKSEGTLVHSTSPDFRKFALVARTLWPRKTAAELAFRANVTERAAKYWLTGTREPSRAAIEAIVSEMLHPEPAITPPPIARLLALRRSLAQKDPDFHREDLHALDDALRRMGCRTPSSE